MPTEVPTKALQGLNTKGLARLANESFDKVMRERAEPAKPRPRTTYFDPASRASRAEKKRKEAEAAAKRKEHAAAAAALAAEAVERAEASTRIPDGRRLGSAPPLAVVKLEENIADEVKPEDGRDLPKSASEMVKREPGISSTLGKRSKPLKGSESGHRLSDPVSVEIEEEEDEKRPDIGKGKNSRPNKSKLQAEIKEEVDDGDFVPPPSPPPAPQTLGSSSGRGKKRSIPDSEESPAATRRKRMAAIEARMAVMRKYEVKDEVKEEPK